MYAELSKLLHGAVIFLADNLKKVYIFNIINLKKV